MDAPTFPYSFTIDISTYFSSNGWSTNVVENLATFQRVAHSTLTFAQNYSSFR